MLFRNRPPAGPVALIGAVVLLLAGGFAWAGGWIGGSKYPGYRRGHAKGLCFTGTFETDGAGAALSSASAFRPGRYPVIGRFSVAGGNPFAPDGRNVFHSMALLLMTPDGHEWRMALDHTPIFPVADVASFVALQRASRPERRTGKPDPAVMKTFLAQHPEVKAFQDYLAQAVLPNSFANATYYSINAFRFTDPKAVTRLVRWQFVPMAASGGLDKKRIDELPRDYLFEEMIARTAEGPSRWRPLPGPGRTGRSRRAH